MWISKEEYNQLKAERDFYEQQLKDWEQEWKNAYKETNPIDGKEKYKTTTDLEKSNNDLKKEKTPVDYLKYYFLEDEVKQLVDLLEVALRDMTLRSTNTIYELQYDSFSHVYRILTTPKTK